MGIISAGDISASDIVVYAVSRHESRQTASGYTTTAASMDGQHASTTTASGHQRPRAASTTASTSRDGQSGPRLKLQFRAMPH